MKKNTNLTTNDNITKKIVLIFFASFFDFYDVILRANFVPFINSNLSPTIDLRLQSIQIISSSLIYKYAFRFKTKRHHKASLVVIGIFLCVTIILDLIYNSNNLHVERFLYTDLLICYHVVGFSFSNCIEKYLVDNSFMNPFLLLLYEGLFGIIISIIFSINREPFRNFIDVYNENTTGYFSLLIFLLLLFFILSIFVNVYKVYCNVVYSPMSRSLIQYLLNPFMNILFFCRI